MWLSLSTCQGHEKWEKVQGFIPPQKPVTRVGFPEQLVSGTKLWWKWWPHSWLERIGQPSNIIAKYLGRDGLAHVWEKGDSSLFSVSFIYKK